MTNMGQRPSKISCYKMVKRCFHAIYTKWTDPFKVSNHFNSIHWSGNFLVFWGGVLFASPRISGYFSTLYLLKKYLPALRNWNSMKFDIRSTQESRGFCLFLGRIKDLFFFSQQTNTTKKILLNHCFELYI